MNNRTRNNTNLNHTGSAKTVALVISLMALSFVFGFFGLSQLFGKKAPLVTPITPSGPTGTESVVPPSSEIKTPSNTLKTPDTKIQPPTIESARDSVQKPDKLDATTIAKANPITKTHPSTPPDTLQPPHNSADEITPDGDQSSIPEADNTPPEQPIQVNNPPETGPFRVQTGVFSTSESAKSELGRVKAKGFDGTISSYKSGDKTLFRVQVGVFKLKQNADLLREKLINAGFTAMVGK